MSTGHQLHLSLFTGPVSTMSSGHVGRTFPSTVRMRREEIEFDPDSLAFGQNEETVTAGKERHLIGSLVN